MEMRVCHCVGARTNPGGVCCMDIPNGSSSIPYVPYTPPSIKPWPVVVPHQSPKKIKSIEYYEDGTVKRIEYFDD